ncbi:RNA lariat debranching enzyme [Penicillium alfredii]|uniref:RNA lariat debranching enzyme n=1 Tax=Penicillium alfredii TaxID=1506179 RepID=A0A9W9FL84_9EURO|nr:RNA lariat debranching enzyme [Penicillium alfredii]KAJ5102263.1 RNA lariat debranching enzyme [Penicillium alfredii]
MEKTLRVVVEGCGHGTLNEIYDRAKVESVRRGWDDIDLVIIGGDFQALRNVDDAACVSVPRKYRQMGDFHEYYSGQRIAPYLTIFIGGNHEASNHLFELYYGGWVAHNIYYMGAANVIRVGPLRICGMSGIWKAYDYRKPHFERLPYNNEDISSAYHVREMDVRKLLQIRTQVDIGLSHDWPRGVEFFGDFEDLFRRKRGFREDSSKGKLGSIAARDVLERLRPAFWFSAHLHVKFAAAMPFDGRALIKNEADTACKSSGEPAAWAVVVSDKSANNNATDEKSTPAGPGAPVSAAAPTPAPTNVPVSQRIALATGDLNSRLEAWNNFTSVAQQSEREQAAAFLAQAQKLRENPPSPVPYTHNVTWTKVRLGENGERQVVGREHVVHTNKKQKMEDGSAQNSDEIALDSSSGSSHGSPSPGPTPAKSAETTMMSTDAAETAADAAAETKTNPTATVHEAVASELRNKLPASLAQAPPSRPPHIKTVVPEAIKNGFTKFLALDKPNNHDPFVQALEITAISDQENVHEERPFRLQYDPEWLAITRVFATDLELGNPNAPVPPYAGHQFYQNRIIEEENWVDEHIVKPGRLNIPANFTRTAPKYDPTVPISTAQMPPEYNNIQTAEFCELVGIPNKFHLTEEESQARMAAGPRPDTRDGGGARRGARRGGRGRGRGRNGPSTNQWL